MQLMGRRTVRGVTTSMDPPWIIMECLQMTHRLLTSLDIFFPSAEYIHNALDTTSGKYPSCLMSASADLSLVSSLIDHMLYAHRDIFLLLPLQVEFSSTVLLA